MMLPMLSLPLLLLPTTPPLSLLPPPTQLCDNSGVVAVVVTTMARGDGGSDSGWDIDVGDRSYIYECNAHPTLPPSPLRLNFVWAIDTLPEGSSLSVEKQTDTLLSANGDFSAGFFQVGENAFCFSVCFTRSKPPTVIWMANRDEPVNGKGSHLSLWKNGNLVLTDAGGDIIWTTTTVSSFQLHLKVTNNGNLVLVASNGTVVWQSFDSPTDTLLSSQPLTERASLVSSRSTTNYSSGFYKLYFDNDNVLRLLYKGPTFSSVYWPAPWELPIDIGRSTYNVTKTAVLDPFGRFTSSDGFQFVSTDYRRKVYRRLKMDPDGNLRLYSFNEEHRMWEVTWQLIPQPCTVHGICGANSMCTYDPVVGRTCYCLKGFKVKDPNDWTQGCEPEFDPSYFSCNSGKSVDFLHLRTTELYGYDWNVTRVSSLKECQNICLQLCDKCRGVQFKFNDVATYNCYPKTMVFNGRDSPNFDGEMYLKLPKAILLSSSKPVKHSPMNCPVGLSQRLKRFYPTPRKNSTLSFLVWFACGIGAFELSTIFLVWFFLFRTSKQPDTVDQQRHLLSATGFQRFTYAELKSATKGFSKETGRGAGGVVYKGTLYDHRVAAVKRLSEANQGEAEFLAEISTIGMLNHMNLIDMWGYCVEGKHRLLVYEYMEHGSLADNLFSNALDWKKRFNVAVGTAKGLAYLHEECLEWILHCDVKPQNILLDSDFQPKVADFGLSKLLNRDERGNSNFSRIRGTRGYMAPEWVYNLRITSKVDVYSYGIVVLETVSGRSPMELIHGLENSRGIEQRRLVTWVTDKINHAATREFWIEEIIDPNLEGRYDAAQVEILVKVALQCVQDDMNERPSMSQVAEMLQSHENKTPP
ncbi:putative receptor protein kinase ZmPK1 [Spatholobus suberectus]|nr:putative receptor protein kinase ZmPK1 [Spatholobus suberectus]